MNTHPIDVLCYAQDQLMIRLIAGRLSTRSLSAAHAEHVATLIAAGYKYDEAAACFWEAVEVARHLHAEENAP